LNILLKNNLLKDIKLIAMEKTVNELETFFEKLSNSAYPNEWDENFLSFSLMQELRRIFSNRTIQFDGWRKLIHWESYKNNGKKETNYGDIALILHIQFSSGEILKGIACIEAKRQYNSGRYEALNTAQLIRTLTMAPYSHLLFYNFNPEDLNLKFPDSGTWRTFFTISPINTSLSYLLQTKNNSTVKRVSFPFSMFLTSRIFWGHDLDYRAEVYNDLSRGENRIIDPSYLGVVNIFYDGQRPINIELGDKWESI
jgi:hypothetical protein